MSQTMSAFTVSHFSYAPLIKCKITRKRNMIFYSETTSVKRIYICISHWNFIVIRSETNEKMDLEGHYPKNTISHCIISNKTRITIHFFQGRISAMPEIRADLFLAISKTGMCLLTSSFFKLFTILGAWLETEGLRVRASPASLRCGPWARHIYPSLVLVQPRKTHPA